MSNSPINRPSFGRVVVLSTLFILIFRVCALGSISISGTYLGKNLRISNPVSEDGFGYAITKVVVNEKIVPLKFNGAEAEIDFSYIGLAPGSPVQVIIRSENERCLVIHNLDVLGTPIITSIADHVGVLEEDFTLQHPENQDDNRLFRRNRKFTPAD